MNEMTFGRVSDLNGLPELILDLGGEEALVRVFERQSVPREILDDSDAVIPMKDIIGLYRSASEITGIRSFGLVAAEDVDLDEYGQMADFVLSATTLKGALARFKAALPYYESGSALSVCFSENDCIIGYQNVFQSIVGFRQAGDMTLRIIEAVIQTYLGPDWHPSSVRLACSNGPWAQDYEDAFQAPAHFCSESLAFTLDQDMFDGAQTVAPPSCDKVVSLEDLRYLGQELPLDFVGSVAHLIRIHLPDGKSRLEDTACKMAIGPRTLQRRLEEYGIGFRELLERVRMQRACELLRGTDATVAIISNELGYSATSHFSRAFSRVFEVTPSEFRTEYAS